ncbi:MAG: metallophosphoesterase [Alphaproteobacteria bacterium]|nr:metallophosphoesterase [Alphaproteobacteria bacterium]
MFTIFAVLQVLAGYICAKGIFYITKINWLSVLIVLFSVTIPFSVFVMHKSIKCEWLLDLICYTGYLYLGFILYFSMFCILAFIVYQLKHDINLRNFLSIGLGSVIIILFFGYLNAINPQLKKLTIPSNSNLRMCFVSDIHVGSINTIHILNTVVKNIRKANPDIVILGGDIIDIKGISTYKDDFINIISPIVSQYKTYAVIGNHELYTGAQDCINLMRKAGITVLLDKSITFNDFTIIGRLDKTISNRKKLNEIIPADKKNLIVIDHSPDSIDESIRNQAFLHLSGHTHGGQMFPMNLVVRYMYKPTGTLDKINNTYYYITYGAGFWGPPYRIGNSPEVMLIELTKTN